MKDTRSGRITALIAASLFCQIALALPAFAQNPGSLQHFSPHQINSHNHVPHDLRSQAYEPHSLIVKFSPGSALGAQWIAQNRSTALTELQSLIGEHSFSAFISEPVLQVYQQRYAARFLRKSALPLTKAEILHGPLAHIAVLRLHENFKLDYLIGKLQDLPGIEYAEKMPRHSFLQNPNDPLAGSQYHLNIIRAFDAWEHLGESRSVLLAIVDTGIESSHPDLQEVLYVNPGEDGLDATGADKRSNGIDDDNNGFVDDWRGWDFGVSESGDNGTNPGSGHGTHVAGIAGAIVNNSIGVAGASPWLELMPVKVASDNDDAFNVVRGSEGILYAAGMGAEVINCSWGSINSSQAEAQIIDAVVDLGVVVVGAAGNSGRFFTFYPASYPRVLAVTSTDTEDQRASFANFHWTVDVSAPGVNITSTDRRGNYGTRDGTSMSAPMAAAAAALVKIANPEMLPEQIIEQIKATAQPIDERNPSFSGQLGRGRLDMFNAVSKRGAQSILIDRVRISDVNGDGIATPGEEISIVIDLWNVLAEAGAANAIIDQPGEFDPVLPQYRFDLGPLERGQRVSEAVHISFVVPQDTPIDYIFTVPLTFRDANNSVGRDGVSLILNPSYRTLNANNITITANSRGNFAYNDFPFNQMGDGFRYQDSRNLMYEGALLVAHAPAAVSNVARSATALQQDNSFLITQPIELDPEGSVANMQATCEYADTLAPGDAGVSIVQQLYQFSDEGHRDYTLVRYDVTNTSGADVAEMFIGLLCDWDIAPGGFSDVTAFDYDRVLYYARNTRDATLPLVGMQLLSEYDVNYFAIDNNSNSGISLFDGFTRDEKWFAMSSGIGRDRSTITDVSSILSAGPISVRDGETVSVAFSIFAGKDFTELFKHADSARVRAGANGIGSAIIKRLPRESALVGVYPNPDQNGTVTIEYQLSAKQQVSIAIFDLLGRELLPVFDGEQRVGEYSIEVKTAALPVGNYVVKLQLLNLVETFALKVMR